MDVACMITCKKVISFRTHLCPINYNKYINQKVCSAKTITAEDISHPLNTLIICIDCLHLSEECTDNVREFTFLSLVEGDLIYSVKKILKSLYF